MPNPIPDSVAALLLGAVPPATAKLTTMPTPPMPTPVSMFGQGRIPNATVKSLAQGLADKVSIPKWQIELLDDNTWRQFQEAWKPQSDWIFSRGEAGTTYIRGSALSGDLNLLRHALAHELAHMVKGRDEGETEKFAKTLLTP